MKDVIAEYHHWKAQGEGLRTEAMRAMESRYRELLTEAIQIAEEYRADFGVALKLPAGVAAFEFKAGGGKKAKPAAPAVVAPASVPAPPSAPNPKLGPLERRLAAARKKLEAAKAAGSPTKNLEDKIYEIEDEIRLAQLA
ncbi:MAG: hypothetical protein NTV52_15615 [Acidobacteria bacterium]|nr:hypothetical protein [Acidobacteriota bacterium]